MDKGGSSNKTCCILEVFTALRHFRNNLALHCSDLAAQWIHELYILNVAGAIESLFDIFEKCKIASFRIL